MDPRTRIEELKGGYWMPVVLLTAGHLGLFAALKDRPHSAAEVAGELALDTRAVEIVLLALVAEDLLLQREDGRFALHPDYAPYLLPDGDESVASIMEHHYHLLGRWIQLAEVVRSGKPVPRPESGRSPEQLRAFICGMRDIARRSTETVAAQVDLSSCRRSTCPVAAGCSIWAAAPAPVRSSCAGIFRGYTAWFSICRKWYRLPKRRSPRPV